MRAAMSRTVKITWEGGTVTGRWRRPRSTVAPAVLLAHGAGTNQDHPSIVALREGLAAAGHPVLTFNYPYTELGKGRPDRQPVLLACHRAALAWLSARSERVVLAGRSMGGRMGTYLAADADDPVDVCGVVLYAYPLHPAGRPERLRADHLPHVRAPMLFFSGTRDALALPELVERWIRPLPGATLELIEEADHSFRVPKRTGLTAESLLERIVERTHEWVTEVCG